jgi:hypothetical protein
MSYDEDAMSHKTGRIAILSILVFLLGFMFFLFKIEACKSSPANCKDEFFEITTDRGYGNSHSCAPGAVAEVVNSPPAPKPGIICHCSPTGATSQGK